MVGKVAAGEAETSAVLVPSEDVEVGGLGFAMGIKPAVSAASFCFSFAEVAARSRTVGVRMDVPGAIISVPGCVNCEEGTSVEVLF